MSDQIEGFSDGDVDTTIDKGRSVLAMTGKNGRVFWSYYEKLHKTYQYGAEDYPQYTKEDAERLALANAGQPCNEVVTLGDLWERRVSYALVPLEEGLFDKWSWGRIATVGDNTHKMTPNYGQGGNNAVESAAALANQLKKLQDSGIVNSESIACALAQWQKKRKDRVEATCNEAAAVCRMQALNSVKAHILAFYIMPNATELLLDLVTGSLIGAEILEYLPVPNRSFEGSCPFNPNQGTGHQESTLKRAAAALPLLLSSYWIQTKPSLSVVDNQLIGAGQMPVPGTGPTTLLFQSFLPLTEEALLYAIWLIESNRRGNAFNLTRLSVVWAILSLIFGPGVIAPWYFFSHYLFSTVEKFAAADMRLTNIAYTRTILPLLLLVLGAALTLDLPSYAILEDGRPWHWDGLWILLPPVGISAVQWLLVKTGVSKITMHSDSMSNQTRDLPYTRWCIYTLSTICGITWLHNILQILLFQTSTPSLSSFALLLLNGHQYTILGNSPQWSRLGLLLSSIVWLTLLISDMKRAGMIEKRWMKFLLLRRCLVQREVRRWRLGLGGCGGRRSWRRRERGMRLLEISMRGSRFEKWKVDRSRRLRGRQMVS
jgi:hypothetical protein